jgi:hypothetical protein
MLSLIPVWSKNCLTRYLNPLFASFLVLARSCARESFPQHVETPQKELVLENDPQPRV